MASKKELENALKAADREITRRELEGYATKAKNFVGGAGRVAAGLPGQMLDVPMLLYNIPQALRGKPGFSFSEKSKEAYDKATEALLGENYKPTTTLGKAAEFGGDLFGPAMFAKILPKVATMVASKVGSAVNTAGQKVGKVTNKIPGKTPERLNKIADSLVGGSAISNVLKRPTVGNLAGAGTTHTLNEMQDDPHSLINTGAGITGGAAIDLIKMALGKKGQKALKTMTHKSLVKNSPELRESVDKLVAEHELAQLKKKQVEAHEKQVAEYEKKVAEHEAKIAETNELIKKEKLEEMKLEKQKRIEEEALQAREQERYHLPDELHGDIQKQSNVKAGETLNEEALKTKAAKEAHFEPIYKEREQFFDVFGGDPIVDINSVKKQYQNEYSKLTTPLARKAFWEGPDGKVRMEVLGLDPHASIKTREGQLFSDTPPAVSFEEAKRLTDLTTGAKGHPEITSGAKTNLKHTASMIQGESKKAFEDINPELFNKVEKANVEYGEYRGKEAKAINKTRENKHEPAQAALDAKAELNADAQIMHSHGTQEASLNAIRTMGVDEHGLFVPKKAATALKAIDPEARSALLKPLSKEQRKAVTKWMRDLKDEGLEKKKETSTKEKPKISSKDKLAVLKEDLGSLNKSKPIESQAAKMYEKEGVTGFKKYAESLDPAQREVLMQDPSVQSILKKETALSKASSTESLFHKANVLGKVYEKTFGSSLVGRKSKPVTETIQRLAAEPISEHGIIQQGAKKVKDVTGKVVRPILGTQTREYAHNKTPVITAWGDEPVQYRDEEQDTNDNQALMDALAVADEEIKRRGG